MYVYIRKLNQNIVYKFFAVVFFVFVFTSGLLKMLTAVRTRGVGGVDLTPSDPYPNMEPVVQTGDGAYEPNQLDDLGM